MRNPPQLEHSGTGLFTITEQTTRSTRNATYAVFTGAGEVVNGVDIVDNTINMNNVFGEYFFSYASDTALRRAVKFVRTSITYTPKSTTSCNDNCGLAYDCAGSPVPNCRPCWGSGDDGTYCCGGICCGGSRGQTCSTTTTNVKDPVPAGYAERYGEWVKIDNPVQTQAVEEPVGFSLSKVEWEPDYYQAVDLPTPHPAEVYDEATGAPTGEVLENVPAWDYTDIYFIHYDTNGDVVWAVDNINDRDCFKIVELERMKNYELWVSNLPPAGEGTYEFVIANSTEEFYREEGNV